MASKELQMLTVIVVLSRAPGETKQQEAKGDLADFPAVFFQISNSYYHGSIPTNPNNKSRAINQERPEPQKR